MWLFILLLGLQFTHVRKMGPRLFRDINLFKVIQHLIQCNDDKGNVDIKTNGTKISHGLIAIYCYHEPFMPHFIHTKKLKGVILLIAHCDNDHDCTWPTAEKTALFCFEYWLDTNTQGDGTKNSISLINETARRWHFNLTMVLFAKFTERAECLIWNMRNMKLG